MNDFTKRFGKNLAHYRRKAALSQDELGIRASLHRTAISELEHGRRVPGIDTLVKLAGALDISPENFSVGWNGRRAKWRVANSK